ncbi:uncharacterized protein MYCFIDRAFT_206935 [Pseudocercospora fijiensis CIRAD86]|uniref:Alcohol acetyltransferase n=1 Tax=Pseudocercospora fijiensis (strain CIRAD86) TaxID=383855 RepID=M3A6N0_PSEFD|nr:uncharacterized protein MYCFIDRAFT_206935 [Pseudocercospora fijiensis CIRAD86]EME86744.1 hypothetical protein MYCFIDRAFT_206935 [Pseudocercospora fijiensis CIRAD86]
MLRKGFSHLHILNRWQGSITYSGSLEGYISKKLSMMRAAGLNEKRCIVRENLNLYNSVATLCTYASSGLPSREDIVEATKACISEHAALSIVIQDADTEQPKISRAETIDVDHHIDFLDAGGTPSELEAILSKSHNEPVTVHHNQPQWRLIIATPETRSGPWTGFHAAFVCSHNLMDGMSGYAFHRTFSRSLNNPKPKIAQVSSTYEVPRDLKLLPPMDARLSISWSYLLGPVIKEYFPSTLSNLLGFSSDNTPSDAWLGAKSRPALPSDSKFPPTSLHLTSVPASTLKNTLSACRNHSTRLTAFLQHLFARALSRALTKRGETHTTFLSQTPIDLRRALGQAQNQPMANYSSALTETIKIPPSLLSTPALAETEWTSIQKLTSKLAAAASTTKDHPVGLLKYLSNFREWTIRKSKCRADVSFEISNLGVFFDDGDNGGETKKYRVENMIFSQSANGTGPPFCVSVASAKDGALMLSVTWWEGMLGVDDEKEFIREICEDRATSGQP